MRRIVHHLKCEYTRSQLDAYVHGTLPIAEKRYVARHLDHCEECRRHHQNLRMLSRELRAQLPVLGRPSHDSVDRVWNAVFQRLEQPAPSRTRWHARRIRIILASAGLLCLLILPTLMSSASVSAAPTLPTQPKAQTSIIAMTQTPTVAARQMKIVDATRTPVKPVSVLNNTPEIYATPR